MIDKATEKYFRWNDGLYDYYFRNSSGLVKLCITVAIINEIGQTIYEPSDTIPNSFVQDFLNSTILTPTQRACFALPLGVKNEDRQTIRRSFNKIIECYSEANAKVSVNGEIKSAPGLGFFMMLLFVFQEEQRTEKNISAYLEPRTGEKFKFDLLDKLHESLKIREINFDAFLPTDQQVHVRILRYHQVLTAKAFNRLNEILYIRGINWDDNEIPLEHLIANSIMPELDIRKSESVDYQLYKALIDDLNYSYFENHIQLFDMNEYEHSCPDKLSFRKQKGNLFLCYEFGEEGGRWGFLSDLRTKDLLSDAQISILPYDGYGSLFPVVLKQTINLNTYKNISLANSISQYSPIPPTNGVLFFIYQPDPNRLLQVLGPDPSIQSYYLIVKNTEIEKVKNKLGDGFVEFDNTICGAGWSILFVSQWDFSIHFGQSFSSISWQKPTTIQLRKGEKNPSNRRRYLVNGLPFLVLPFESSLVKSVKAIDLRTKSEYTLIHNIIDDYQLSIKFDEESILSFAHEHEFEILIDQSAEQVNSPRQYIMISPSTISRGQIDYFKYDSWGMYTNSANDTYYSDNSVVGKVNVSGDTDIRYFRMSDFDSSTDGYRLIDLLVNYQEYSKDKFIPSGKMDHIIDHIAIGNGIKQDGHKRWELKNALTELGYVSYCHKNDTYQVNSPRFHKRLITNNGKGYVIYGSYSLIQLSNLHKELKELKFSCQYHNCISEYSKKNNQYLSLIPDFICVDFPNDNIQLSTIPIDREPNAIRLSGFVSNMRDFNTKFISQVKYSIDSSYPEYAPAKELNKPHIRLSASEDLYNFMDTDGIASPIPDNLMKLFVQNCHQRPIFYTKSDYSKIYFTKKMGIPTLVKKSLYEISLERAEKVYCFGLDNLFGDKLFSVVTTISKIPSRSYLNRVSQKMTGKSNIEIENNSQVVNVTEYDKYKQYSMDLYKMGMENGRLGGPDYMIVVSHQQIPIAVVKNVSNTEFKSYSVFAKRKNYESSRDNAMYKLLGNSINDILTSILNNATLEYTNDLFEYNPGVLKNAIVNKLIIIKKS